MESVCKDYESRCYRRQVIICLVIEEDGFEWVGCGIYVSNDYVERKIVWNTLDMLLELKSPLMAIGTLMLPSIRRIRKAGRNLS